MVTTSLAEQIGAHIARTRERRAWSQQRLTDELHRHGSTLSRGTVAKIERNIRKPTIDELALFAAALNVSPLDLIAPDNPAEPVRVGNQTVTASCIADWIRGDRPLPDSGSELTSYERERHFAAGKPAGEAARWEASQDPGVRALDRLAELGREVAVLSRGIPTDRGMDPATLREELSKEFTVAQRHVETALADLADLTAEDDQGGE